MKIAIPIEQDRLGMHFGHCKQFALVEVDEQSRTVVGREDMIPPPHEPGVLPRWLKEQGANVVIAGGMGQHAKQLFSQNGITVIVGAQADSCDKIVAAYLQGTLQTGQNVCDH